MELNSSEFKKLVNMIKDSFRVRKNHRPTYVDIAGNLDRIGAPQHQVIFGRRGSGKSCLLVHYLNEARPKDVHPVYILADEYKRLTYPDVLIRLLLEIFEALPVRWLWLKKLLRRRVPSREHAQALRRLLDMADESDVTEDEKKKSTYDARGTFHGEGVGGVTIGGSSESARGRTSRFKERKSDMLERHLRDYKRTMSEVIKKWGGETGLYSRG